MLGKCSSTSERLGMEVSKRNGRLFPRCFFGMFVHPGSSASREAHQGPASEQAGGRNGHPVGGQGKAHSERAGAPERNANDRLTEVAPRHGGSDQVWHPWSAADGAGQGIDESWTHGAYDDQRKISKEKCSL